MARWEFKLPDIGEGVTEGEIVNWLISPGETVKEDQPMVEVMTDKATVTIAVPRAGTVLELRGKVGDIVAVHSTLVVFDVGGAAPATAHANGSGNGHGNATDGPAATAVGDIRETLPGMTQKAPPAAAGAGGGLESAYFNEKPLATPATRKTARDLGIDLKRVPPTGPQGRVTREDVETFAHQAPAAAQGPAAAVAKPAQEAPPPAPTPQAHAPAREPVKISPPAGSSGALEERVPFAGMRRRIAAKMSQSKTTAAHFTFVEECDVSALKALRARLKPQADAQGVKLSFLPFIVKAVIAALRKHPILNSALDESTNELVYRKYFHIGIAASTDAGLIVPVVKNADRKSILEIARDIDRLASEAKEGKSKVEDLSGSTFTITSLGAQGGLFATPIINFPEVGILGVHQIKQKPVVRDGQIVIGEVMLLSLSFDHRIVDGHVGAAFAYDVIGFLENPDRLFLEMA
ncbi:2-oxo acid dehydrogenase subunit E2 [Pendulispora brunnea]|uniref:Dihydrolipoamide acetyltransferase component of pyruvate dehydrogenase complex n=1 Tax=Pendulispora brunnea TaxID=2905690 RepID=A0ABZ2KIG6_9BACT